MKDKSQTTTSHGKLTLRFLKQKVCIEVFLHFLFVRHIICPCSDASHRKHPGRWGRQAREATTHRLAPTDQCRPSLWGSAILCLRNASLLVLNCVFCSLLRYRIYDLSSTFYTKPVWKIVNPQIEETVQFTALNASQEFLNYLQTNALVVDLWGLQGTLSTSSVA